MLYVTGVIKEKNTDERNVGDDISLPDRFGQLFKSIRDLVLWM